MKKREKERDYLTWSLVVIVLIIAAFVIYGNLFYFKDCKNQACFTDYLTKCHQAKFIRPGEMVFEYKILGRKNDKCIVQVKLLRGDLSNKDSRELEGKEMKCEVPLGAAILPESNIDNCHGYLKEGLQDLIIAKLHKYIVQNIGEINVNLKS